MGRFMALTTDQVNQLKQRHSDGWSNRMLAAEYGVSETTIRKYIRRFNLTNGMPSGFVEIRFVVPLESAKLIRLFVRTEKGRIRNNRRTSEPNDAYIRRLLKSSPDLSDADTEKKREQLYIKRITKELRKSIQNKGNHHEKSSNHGST